MAVWAFLAILEQGQWLIALLILSMVHNFTSGFGRIGARILAASSLLNARCLHGLPVVVAMAGYSGMVFLRI